MEQKLEELFEFLFSNGFITVERHIPSNFTVVRSSDAVAVLIYILEKGVLLIEQNRPALISDDNPTGVLTEVVAGRFDCNLSPTELIIKEVEEEVGGKICADQIAFLNNGKPIAVGPGLIADKIFLACAVVSWEQFEQTERIFGHYEEQEKIIRKIVSVEELRTMEILDMKTFALVQWFLREFDSGGFI